MSTDERSWGMYCHLAALAGIIPFLGIIATVVVWQMKKDVYPFVADQGKESLNFQITVLIVAIAASFLHFTGLGFLVSEAIGIIALVFIIMGIMQSNQGTAYRYPINFRLIK